MAKPKHYELTQTAERDFRDAKEWSLSRWGKSLTKKYFKDLHEGAEKLGKYHYRYAKKESLSGVSGIGVHAIREHFIIYVPVDSERIVIVGLIRQSRDVPAIVKANYYIINKELKKYLDKIEK